MRTYNKDKVKGGNYFLILSLLDYKSQKLIKYMDEFHYYYR